MFPSFLCIGAQKAGTTWLYDNIKDHPEVWMAPVKEIFYFDAKSRLPLVLQLCRPGNRGLRQHTLGGIRKRLRRRRPGEEPAAAAPAPAPAGPRPSALSRALWHLRFMVLLRHDRWYGSLFTPGPGQIAGDINPYLAHLPRDRVAHIHSLMPDARIVYLIRNPIDRLWSQLGMSLREQGLAGLEDVDQAELKHNLELASRSELSAYLENLAVWRGVFGEDQVFVGFFDQLVEDPGSLLRDIYRFLGLRADDEVIPPGVRKKSNPGTGPRIPEHHANLLAQLFEPQLEQLHRHFDNRYTDSWLAAARQRLAATHELGRHP